MSTSSLTAMLYVAVIAAVAAGASAAPLKCGIASADLHSCPSCFKALYHTGALDFWWNWGTAPKLDTSSFTPEELAAVNQTFVPMCWGQGVPDDLSFLDTSDYIMGFNEPDMYGPACNGDWNPPAYGCQKGEWRAATSSGWQPLFDPKSAAHEWAVLMRNLTTRGPQRAKTVVSPSMAMFASGAGSDCVGVDPAKEGALKHCPGWLDMFKAYSIQEECTDFDGTTTNCWDMIDVIQFHAYAHYPQAVTAKVEDYYKVFRDDLDGVNGRTKKTLWLTEVAMGSNNVDAITNFMTQMMSKTDGLRNRVKYPYLEKISWFSNWAFGSFELDGVVPNKNEVWSSGLVNPFGSLSPIGQLFVDLCNDQ